jgi:hypothetical protein
LGRHKRPMKHGINMSKSITNPLDYYALHGTITNPEQHAVLFDGLPSDISGVCQVTRGLLMHFGFAQPLFGLELSEEKKEERELRHVSKMLARIQELDGRPLTVSRPPEKRLMGNCRDLAVFSCALLRHHGIPARARRGFAKYFHGPVAKPGFYVDHWLCEYWKADEQRWVLFDSEMGSDEREYCRVTIDTYDVPREQFLVSGKAWQLCRTGQANPNNFGFDDEHGEWFIQDSLVQDLAALNKIEVLCWDGWGLADREPDDSVSAKDLALLDDVATLTIADNSAFLEMQFLYENDVRLRVPDVIRSYTRTGIRKVTL